MASDVTWGVDGNLLVDSVGLSIPSGEICGLLGPNGSGKTSFLRVLYRSLVPWRGQVSLNGVGIESLSRNALARTLAVVTQETSMEFDCTVRECVQLGRNPHKSLREGWTPDDDEICSRSLERVEAEHLQGRFLSSLSGGERQRVLVARALAQEPRCLILDEPTNHLDIQHQVELMRLVRSLGLTTLVAIHDLNLAARYCDRLCLLQRGRVVATGAPSDVLTPERILEVYGVSAEVRLHPTTGALNIVYLG